jgi:hypothetical protein
MFSGQRLPARLLGVLAINLPLLGRRDALWRRWGRNEFWK